MLYVFVQAIRGQRSGSPPANPGTHTTWANNSCVALKVSPGKRDGKHMVLMTSYSGPIHTLRVIQKKIDEN